MTIDAKQIRAARALLNWSRDDLANYAGVSVPALARAEAGESQLRNSSILKIVTALEKAGVEFMPNFGVRMRNDLILKLEGDDANSQLLEDVFQTLAGRPGSTVYIAGVKEEKSISDLDLENLKKHISRLSNAGISEKLLIEEGDHNLIAPKDYYRVIPKAFFENVPIQVYGDKIAFIEWGPPKQIIVVQNKGFAKALAKLIDFAWNSGQKP